MYPHGFIWSSISLPLLSWMTTQYIVPIGLLSFSIFVMTLFTAGKEGVYGAGLIR